MPGGYFCWNLPLAAFAWGQGVLHTLSLACDVRMFWNILFWMALIPLALAHSLCTFFHLGIFLDLGLKKYREICIRHEITPSKKSKPRNCRMKKRRFRRKDLFFMVSWTKGCLLSKSRSFLSAIGWRGGQTNFKVLFPFSVSKTKSPSEYRISSHEIRNLLAKGQEIGLRFVDHQLFPHQNDIQTPPSKRMPKVFPWKVVGAFKTG